jgi:hypothetical protein
MEQTTSSLPGRVHQSVLPQHEHLKKATLSSFVSLGGLDCTNLPFSVSEGGLRGLVSPVAPLVFDDISSFFLRGDTGRVNPPNPPFVPKSGG